MYTGPEIVVVFNNCNTEEEVYDACAAFRYLIGRGWQCNSELIRKLANLKMREVKKQ